MNIIPSGYDRRKDAPIWISLWPVASSNGIPSGLRIVLEDEAKQVDPSMIKSRDLDEVRPGGLGVHIIQQVMDEAKYEKREHGGMRLTLVKRKSSDAARGGSCDSSTDRGAKPGKACG